MYIALYIAEQRDILFLYITLYSIRHTPTPTPYAKNTPKHNIGVYDKYMGEFVVEGFFSLEVVTFFVTLRADLEDYFKCMT